MDQKLSTFLTLCSTMNYRRAADALHLTQPAVTKQIQALEAQYGVKLFSYDERKLRKTPQGEILERYAISLQYNDAELTRLLAEKPKTLLRIGATKSIGDYILIPEIRRYLEMPDNELYFTVDNTAHLLATFCCAPSRISASAQRITRGAGKACGWRSCFPSA